jgi:hypothetical protein
LLFSSALGLIFNNFCQAGGGYDEHQKQFSKALRYPHLKEQLERILEEGHAFGLDFKMRYKNETMKHGDTISHLVPINETMERGDIISHLVPIYENVELEELTKQERESPSHISTSILDRDLKFFSAKSEEGSDDFSERYFCRSLYGDTSARGDSCSEYDDSSASKHNDSLNFGVGPEERLYDSSERSVRRSGSENDDEYDSLSSRENDYDGLASSVISKLISVTQRDNMPKEITENIDALQPQSIQYIISMHYSYPVKRYPEFYDADDISQDPRDWQRLAPNSDDEDEVLPSPRPVGYDPMSTDLLKWSKETHSWSRSSLEEPPPLGGMLASGTRTVGPWMYNLRVLKGEGGEEGPREVLVYEWKFNTKMR